MAKAFLFPVLQVTEKTFDIIVASFVEAGYDMPPITRADGSEYFDVRLSTFKKPTPVDENG